MRCSAEPLRTNGRHKQENAGNDGRRDAGGGGEPRRAAFWMLSPEGGAAGHLTQQAPDLGAFHGRTRRKAHCVSGFRVRKKQLPETERKGHVPASTKCSRRTSDRINCGRGASEVAGPTRAKVKARQITHAASLNLTRLRRGRRMEKRLPLRRTSPDAGVCRREDIYLGLAQGRQALRQVVDLGGPAAYTDFFSRGDANALGRDGPPVISIQRMGHCSGAVERCLPAGEQSLKRMCKDLTAQSDEDRDFRVGPGRNFVCRVQKIQPRPRFV